MYTCSAFCNLTKSVPRRIPCGDHVTALDPHWPLSLSVILNKVVINFPLFTGNLIKHFVFLPHFFLAVLQCLITHFVEVAELLNAEILSGKVTSFV